MKIARKKQKIIVAIAGIVTAIASIAVIPNLTFIYRLLTYPKNPITNTDWYQPLAKVSGNPTAIAQADTTVISQDSLNKVAKYAQTHNSSALLVVHQGKLVLEKYWQGFTPSSTFNAMSMSKTIVSLLVGIAIAEGDIKSELEPVANYIPEWSNSDRPKGIATLRSKITIQDLLYMQSGLQNRDNQKNPWSDLVRMYAGRNANAVAVKIRAAENTQEFFSYNNANTQILGQVLEKATGTSYANYLSSRLWQPIQAKEAHLWLDRPGGNPKPFCCMFATPRDWAKVGQLFIDRGRVNGKQVVDSQWLDRMLQSSPLEPKYGYHIWLKARTKSETGAYDVTSSQPFLTQDAFYLDGASRQRVYIIPSQELVIVRIGEEPQTWDDSVIPNTLISDLQNQ